MTTQFDTAASPAAPRRYPSLRAFAASVLRILDDWADRNSRHALMAELTDDQLRDIGLTRDPAGGVSDSRRDPPSPVKPPT